jgi:hypothetical protein
LKVNRISRIFAVGTCALLAAIPPSEAASVRVSTGLTVVNVQQISRDEVQGPPSSEPDTQVEPDLAQDPNDPGSLVAVFQEGRFPDGAAVAAGYARTSDGGSSWSHGELPHLTTATGGPYERAGDHVAAYGPDGSAYVATTAFDGEFVPDRRSALAVIRSNDGGTHWRDPIFIQRNRDLHVFNDNPAIAVDTSPTSPFAGRIYVAWLSEHFSPDFSSLRAPIVMRYSDDRGITWSNRVTVADPSSNDQGTQVVVQPDGVVTVLWEQIELDGSQVEVARTSSDGGATFTSQQAVGEIHWVESPGMRTGFGLAAAAANPTTGGIFVVWQDGRFRTDGLNDVVLSTSVDGGVTWSSPRRVNSDAPDSGIDRFTPDVAAYGKSVAVTYLSRGHFGASHLRPFVQETFVQSDDGGRTFGTELALGPSTDIRFAAQAFGLTGLVSFLADYMGVTLSATGAHAVWAFASFNGQTLDPHQTIWSATVMPEASHGTKAISHAGSDTPSPATATSRPRNRLFR